MWTTRTGRNGRGTTMDRRRAMPGLISRGVLWRLFLLIRYIVPSRVVTNNNGELSFTN
ncbi:hypothetical protein EX30DRAFT_101192, partial [Ascodesmis nigricans]